MSCSVSLNELMILQRTSIAITVQWTVGEMQPGFPWLWRLTPFLKANKFLFFRTPRAQTEHIVPLFCLFYITKKLELGILLLTWQLKLKFWLSSGYTLGKQCIHWKLKNKILKIWQSVNWRSIILSFSASIDKSWSKFQLLAVPPDWLRRICIYKLVRSLEGSCHKSFRISYQVVFEIQSWTLVELLLSP